MDPRFRLHRKFPGEGLADLRPISARLAKRDKPLREPMPQRESAVVVRVGKTRRPSKMGKTSPNAPLLKRLVRYPYRQHTTDGRRRSCQEPIPWDLLGVEERKPVSDALVELRASLLGGSPLRNEPRPRPEVRSRASVAEWLSGSKK